MATYEVIGEPRVEAEYSDEYETTMVIDVKRDDGETGDVWIVAGVPASDQGSSRASGHQTGFVTVGVFGDSVDCWCPDNLLTGAEDDEDEAQCHGPVAEGHKTYYRLSSDIIDAVWNVAKAVHMQRVYDGENVAQEQEEN